MSEPDFSAPLFITGASRSGTAMLRSILLRDPSIGLTGETHYFDDLRPRLAGRPLDSLSEQERMAAADYFRAITVRPYGKLGDPDQSWLTREDLLTKAERLGGQPDHLFEAFCKLCAARRGASTWGEKTPRHIFRIDDILAAYPTARIICMLRDPRAVVASYRDWYKQDRPVENLDPDHRAALRADQERARKSYHIVLASLMWRAAANAALAARDLHGEGHVRIVRYDDVVSDPEPVLRDVTGWLGITYDSRLLDIPLHNSSTMEFNTSAGISRAPQNRWRDALSDREINVIQKVAGQALTRSGFAPEPVRPGLLDMPLAYAGLPLSVFRAAQVNRHRYNSLPRYVWRRLRAAMRP